MQLDQHIAVIGAGTMGNGIAHVMARSGLQVTLIDADAGALARGRELIEKNLGREVKKGSLTHAAAAEALTRITSSLDLGAAADAQVIIEAVPERRELKREIFALLDQIASPSALLASNTSSISITELGAATRTPARVVGMHFMNPVPVMALVEVIRALQTGDAAFQTTMQLCEKIGKKPVAVNDSPGFVSNRVLMPLINEAAFCVEEGVATAEAVDAVMKTGMNHPMGPLELADFIGLDVCVDVMDVLFEGFRDPKFRACPLLRKMVAAGWLGRKSNRGFYTYSKA